MVFKHNKQPFDNDDYCQLAYKHFDQLDSSGQLTSSAEISSGCKPEKQPISDEETDYLLSQSRGEATPEGDAEIGNHTAINTPNDNSANAYGSTSSLPITSEVIRSGHGKRLFSDDKFCQDTCKRMRQVEKSSQLCSFAEIPLVSSCEGASISDERDAVYEDSGKNSGSVFSLPWFTCSRNEEDMRLELPARLPFFPAFYGDDYHASGFCRPPFLIEKGLDDDDDEDDEEIPSPIFDYPPRRIVAIGPNHQADVPVWSSQCNNNPNGESSGLDSCSTSSVPLPIEEDGDNRWVGACVIPMSDLNSLVLDDRDGHFETDCCCTDEGSIRCVRRHVKEARDKLLKALGHKCFKELGFQEMGEDVAMLWTEEEEHLFQEVVISNPASLGKNFWDDLPQVLPSRSSKELISYYFNVFMLRKRAEQNRSDPLNVDSDNDEWQDSDDGEFAMTEDDEEDAGVESPLVGDGIAHSNEECSQEDIHKEVDDGDDCDEHDLAGEDINEELYDISKFGPVAQPVIDQNVQDDSSHPSYEGQHNGADSGGHADVLGTCGSLVEGDHENLHSEYRNHETGGMIDREYIVGQCDPRPWEIGYIDGTGKEIDFLPTCNVIEEVFGKEPWENENTEGHGIS